MDHVDHMDLMGLMDLMDLMDPSKWLDPDLDKKMPQIINLGPFLSTFWESIRNQISRVLQQEPPTFHHMDPMDLMNPSPNAAKHVLC